MTANKTNHPVKRKKKLPFHHDPSVETVERSIIKTISYRIVIGIMEFIVIYFVTGRPAIALGFIVISTVYSMITFYFHDRIWDRIKWGKVDP